MAPEGPIPLHPELNPEELLIHARWIRRLALELVGDPARAEDLVQDTWLVAMTRPPRARGALRAWLARVVQNLARQSHRGETRRTSRERRVVEREEPASTDELIEAVDAQRTVVEELLRLDEPYRSVLVLRFFQDLEPVAIARRRGQPAATVRSQLARGLTLLRGRMDARNETGRSHWATLLAPALARPGGAPPHAAATGALATTGVMTMNVLGKIGIAAAFAGSAYVGWTVLETPGPEPLRDTPVASRGAELAELEPTRGSDANVRREVPEPELHDEVAGAEAALASVPLPLPGARPPAVVEAHFVDDQGLPVPAVALVVLSVQSGEGSQASSDDTGAVRVELTIDDGRALSHVASWTSPHYVSGERQVMLEAGRSRHMGTILLAGCAHVEGRVLDTDGQPLVGAHVWWEAGELPEREPRLLRRFGSGRREGSGPLAGAVPAMAVASDERGEYQLGGVPTTGVRIWAGLEHRRIDWSELLVLAAGDVRRGVDLVIAELEPEDHISGRVVGPDGEPLPEARVSFQFDAPDLGMTGGLQLEADGSFDFLVHRDVPHRFSARLSDSSLTPASAAGVRPGTLDLLLQLGTDEGILVSVRDEEGWPVEHFALAFLYISEKGSVWSGEGPRDHPEGRARVVPGAGSFRLSVSADGFATGVAGPFLNGIVPGGEIDIVLSRIPALRGVVLADGIPVPGALVSLAPLLPKDYWAKLDGYATQIMNSGKRAVADANGRFELTPEGAGEHRLRVEPPPTPPGRDPAWAPVELASVWVTLGTEIEDFELELARPGTLVVQVRRADSGDPAGTLVSLNRYDGHPLVVVADGAGRVRVPGLMPGGWAVGVAEQELSHYGSSSSAGRGAVEEWPYDCDVRPGETTTYELLVPASD